MRGLFFNYIPKETKYCKGKLVLCPLPCIINHQNDHGENQFLAVDCQAV